MIEFAMFIKALLIPLFGLALSNKSSAQNPTSALATVTEGASISLNNLTPSPAPSSSLSWPRKSSSSNPFQLELFLGVRVLTTGASSNWTRFGVLGAPSGRGWAKEDCLLGCKAARGMGSGEVEGFGEGASMRERERERDSDESLFADWERREWFSLSLAAC
jgi:hypothetical protein